MKHWILSKYTHRNSRTRFLRWADGMRCKAQTTAIPNGIAWICNAAARPSGRARNRVLEFRWVYKQQQGMTLMVSLVMLVVILMFSTSLAHMALIGEKAARNERDKQIALQAAESALADAEKDIDNSNAATSRSAIFSPDSTEGFTPGCGRGDGNKYQGLCTNSGAGQSAVWLTAGITNNSANSPSVQFGRFTGQTMPTSASSFPRQLPRYVIELIRDTATGQSANIGYMYRITAVGFGSDSSTQILLQSFYRKMSGSSEVINSDKVPLKAGRLSWREISNRRDIKLETNK